MGDFAGVFGDTISLRLPAYAPARTRSLRGGTPITADSIYERKVDVTLDVDVYKRINITDEELTLDIRDFGAQVLSPIVTGIGLELENQLIAEVHGASYTNDITYDLSSGDPWKDIILASRRYLNLANVPMANRRLIVGSNVENALLGSDQFIRADHSGAAAIGAFQEAKIGRVGGFDVYAIPGLAVDEAYAFHPTAYVMSQRAPAVPSGSPYGAVQTYDGFALRVCRVFDTDYLLDQLVANSWVGTQVVKDTGHYTADPDAGGKFVPVTDPATPLTGHTDDWRNDTAKLVRAVKIVTQA